MDMIWNRFMKCKGVFICISCFHSFFLNIYFRECSLSWHYGRCEEDFIGKYTYYCSKSAEKALKNKNFDDLFDFANETVNVLKTHPNEEILQDIGKLLILGVASAEMTLNSSSIDNENAYIREYLDPLVELEGRVKDMLANN